MKKILQIVDSYDWAIGTLAKAIVDYNQHFSWTLMAVHPKDLERGKVDLNPIIEAVKNADIIDVQYWRTCSQLMDNIPEMKKKPVILTHHNEKNLLSYEPGNVWPENVIHVAKTKYSQKVLEEAHPKAKIVYIPNSFDHKKFHYNIEPTEEKIVGYVGRIVPWKGLKEVAKACYELGYPLMLMGKPDKEDYFNSIPQEHRDNIRWDFFKCDDNDRIEYYKHIRCYVGFSGGGREVGTLGFIEALASGVPVVTTPSGLAADIGEHEENMLIVDYDDVDGLKEQIHRIVENPSLHSRIRRNGWETIRGYNDQRMAWQYRNLYNSLLYKGDIVSVIIPTTPDRLDKTTEILDALEKQTYRDFEAVVVFDQCSNIKDLPVEALKSRYTRPIKFLATNTTGGYNLAMARNIGAIEADGKYLMINDSRLKPAPDAMERFINAIKDTERTWIFGSKGFDKETFVENFSMIRRKDYIGAGMSNERINQYGGMSQELRTRFASQGFTFNYVPEAQSEQMCKSSLSVQKRDGIINMKNLLYKLGLN